MQVSIVILNYNTFTLTVSAINSVFEKTKELDYEIILVDNASTECNPDLFKVKFPTINLIKNTTNSGFAKGNNLGIAQAKGKYILLLNSDAEFKNNAAFLAYHRLEKDREIGVLSSKLIYPDGRMQYPAQRFECLSRELRELFRLNKKLSGIQRAQHYLGDAFDHTTEIECDWVWGAFFMFRRDILEQLPEQKLADTFFMYAEDVQWCYQIRKLGFKIIYYPEAEVIHHLGGSDKQQQDEEEKYFTRILPNMYTVLQIERGKAYAFFTYFVRAILLLSLRNQSDIQKAKRYLNLIFKRLLHSE